MFNAHHVVTVRQTPAGIVATTSLEGGVLFRLWRKMLTAALEGLAAYLGYSLIRQDRLAEMSMCTMLLFRWSRRSGCLSDGSVVFDLPRRTRREVRNAVKALYLSVNGLYLK